MELRRTFSPIYIYLTPYPQERRKMTYLCMWYELYGWSLIIRINGCSLQKALLLKVWCLTVIYYLVVDELTDTDESLIIVWMEVPLLCIMTTDESISKTQLPSDENPIAESTWLKHIHGISLGNLWPACYTVYWLSKRGIWSWNVCTLPTSWTILGFTHIQGLANSLYLPLHLPHAK